MIVAFIQISEANESSDESKKQNDLSVGIAGLTGA
jgi:hypothetical protein